MRRLSGIRLTALLNFLRLINQTKIAVVIRPAIFLFLSTFFVFADETKIDLPQWKQCWQFSATELGSLQPTAFQERIFLPLADGSLLALNSKNGETLWRAELGGEITGQLPVNGVSIFAASKIAATNEKQASVVIRALSLTTGLTIWQGEFLQASQISLAIHENSLLVSVRESAETSKIIALSTKNGELLWSNKQTKDLVTPLKVVGNAVYFATTDKMLYALKIADGGEIRHFSLPHAAQGNIEAANGVLLFSDAAGKVFSVRESDGKVLWELRLGGAADSILPNGNGVLISSLDNFVYFHRLDKGKRIWRKRLSSRPLGASILNEQTALLTVSGENNAALINLKNGKIVGQLLLDSENTAVFPPLFSGEQIFIPILRGILSFAPANTNCPTK